MIEKHFSFVIGNIAERIPEGESSLSPFTIIIILGIFSGVVLFYDPVVALCNLTLLVDSCTAVTTSANVKLTRVIKLSVGTSIARRARLIFCTG